MLKKSMYLAFVLSMVFGACKKEAAKNYVTLSGTILHPNSDSLVIAQRSVIKTIKVNADGTFSDTLKVETGSYGLFDGTEGTTLYLKNGYDLNVSLDTKAFDETLKYEGIGSEANNYMAQKALLMEKLYDYTQLMALSKADFNAKMASNTSAMTALLTTAKNLDTALVSSEKEQMKMMGEQWQIMFDEVQFALSLKGKEAPKFIDYENNAGGTLSLDDLKSKYVYIDLWATWCVPCKKEIPYLKKVEEAYHDKNIAFVSISIDRKKDHGTWKTMIKEENLTGIQLFANEDKTFRDAYKVSGIPRFILIDPEGIVVDANAPKPSSKELTKVLDGLMF